MFLGRLVSAPIFSRFNNDGYFLISSTRKTFNLKWDYPNTRSLSCDLGFERLMEKACQTVIKGVKITSFGKETYFPYLDPQPN